MLQAAAQQAPSAQSSVLDRLRTGCWTGNQCSDSDTFHSRILTAHHEQLWIGFASVATAINVTQKPTHDTISEKDDMFHEDKTGLEAENVQFLCICTQVAHVYLSKCLLVY